MNNTDEGGKNYFTILLDFYLQLFSFAEKTVLYFWTSELPKTETCKNLINIII